jgi:GT2 family glycosyltransferase
VAETANSSAPAKVAAIVVTYNRLTLLRECLAAVRGQTRGPDALIVINNSSTDGTAAWLQEQSDLTVITQPNLGSSGGQHAGIKEAYRQGHDWFWCMDDDTIPDIDALEKLLACPKADQEQTAFLCSAVRWIDGSPHKNNPPATIGPREGEVAEAGLATFVSLLVARRAVAAGGLPKLRYFIALDDIEYTDRMSGAGYKGYVVFNSRVLHKTPTNELPDLRSWKRLYQVRNETAWVRGSIARNWKGKLCGIAGIFARELGLVLRGKTSPRVLAWFVRGLFLSNRIDYV